MTQREAIALAWERFDYTAYACPFEGKYAVGEIKDPDGGFSPWVVGESYEDCFAQLEKP